jgi:ribosomal protein S18 acetylase RimI-like enzyme
VRIETGGLSQAWLNELVAGSPFKPHRGSWRGDTRRLDALLGERLQRTLSREDAASWTVDAESGPSGLAILYPLEWDSRVLGMHAGRLELLLRGEYGTARQTADRLVEDACGAARERGIRHLSCRVDAADDPSVHALEGAGFLNVDALLTFAAAPDPLTREQVPELTSRSASSADATELGEIAAEAFTHGRFHADPDIPPDRARDVYRRWIAACCEKTAADEVIVVSGEGGIAGFVACRMLPDTAVHLDAPTGTIPLIATSERWRGRGVGSALLSCAGRWFSAQRAVVVETGTQLRNVPAARLYERSGFRLVSGALSFRRMIEQP